MTLKGPITIEVVRDIFSFVRRRLPQYMRPRRLEFNLPLPKTISGKIRRNELRALEAARFAAGFDATARRPNEWWEGDPGAQRRRKTVEHAICTSYCLHVSLYIVCNLILCIMYLEFRLSCRCPQA